MLFFLFKKEEVSFCENLRGIGALNVRSKVPSSAHVRRSQIVVDEFGIDA
jgi:hypothetical protein